MKNHSIKYVKNHSNMYLFEKLLTILGNHCKITNVAIDMLENEPKSTLDIRLHTLSDKFVKLAPFFPTLSIEWCYLLTVLNYSNRTYWNSMLRINEAHTKPEMYVKAHTNSLFHTHTHTHVLSSFHFVETHRCRHHKRFA